MSARARLAASPRPADSHVRVVDAERSGERPVAREAHGDVDERGADAYGRSSRPLVAAALRGVGLDVHYHRAIGDYVWYRNAAADEVEVLDLVGGYGTSLLGHNHPRLVGAARRALDACRPFSAQASLRGPAGVLAERLCARVAKATGRTYMATLASTGAEAVEAAIKHAELELVARFADVGARNTRIARAFAATGASLPSFVASYVADLTGKAPPSDVGELCTMLESFHAAAFASRPTFLALEGAFHGKTLGALGLTHGARARGPWARLTLPVEFVAVGDEVALHDLIAKHAVTTIELLTRNDGSLEVKLGSITNIAAAFVEPIQGEGGVHEVPASFLRAMRDATAAASIPLVIDEIQTGLGRTGSFLASEPSGVVGDYYLFSKALGGGVAKISALLVDGERYQPDFGMLHTSTFAEDDLSSLVALEVLALIDEDDGAVLRSCATKGATLREALDELRVRYPDQIADVRGRGLMLAVTFGPQEASRSSLLRVLSDQGLLGYAVAGYLLATEQIRVAPTLSAPSTVRIQPSAFVTERDLARVVDAIERVALLLRRGDASTLALALAGEPTRAPDTLRSPETAAPSSVVPASAARRATSISSATNPRVAFLGHLLEDADLRDWDRTLAPLTTAECGTLLARTRTVLSPFVLGRHTVAGASGRAVDVDVIAVPFTAAQVMDGFARGDVEWARAQVLEAVALASARGCRVVGFGGYTSIVADGCRAIGEGPLALTSGNALTVASTVHAACRAMDRFGFDRVRLGVVGALGNIGHVVADLLAERADEIVLVGRPAARSRLLRRAEELRRASTHRELSVTVATDASALRACNVVVSATNAARPLLFAEHFGDGPVIVCDVATPGDVDPAVAASSSHVHVLHAGRVRLPHGQAMRLPGIPSLGRDIFGCLAETLLLGLEGATASFSIGALTPGIVRQAADMAARHGFELDGGELR
jgi:acetylornithine/succinyldiaminopimelate/putrescine aminotransferase/predicted amino acid dehydrogenase